MAKKIGAIVSLSIIGILILLTIILANVQINHRIDCEKPQHVYVYSNGIASGASQEEATKIVDYINNASKEVWLSAFFGGTLNDNAKVVANKGTISISADSYYVSYVYNEEQTVKVNNKAYVDAEGKTCKFEELLFEVNNASGKNEVKVYIVPYAENNLKYTHYYTVNADFSDLYNYIDGRF